MGSVIAWGVRIISKPSLSGSAGDDFHRLRVTSGPASPRMSIGLAWLQCREDRVELGRRLGESSASLPPLRDQGVGRRARPGPPALVTIVSLGPFGRGCLASTSAMSNTSAMLSTRSTPHAAKGGVEHFVAAGQRAGVRGGGLGGGLGAAGLDDDDRLGQGDLARRREERPGVADRFHVDDDALRVGIVAQEIDQVAPVDVEHRADGDEAR